MVPRWLEFVLAFVGLIALSPLFLLIIVAIKLDSRGSAFYLANRVGQGKAHFKMYKFRTMTPQADQTGPPITVNGDNRITRVGRFLRRTKLDELPQLINILKGEMRFVGPRPEDPTVAENYSESQQNIFRFKPGITSPASIAYRSEEAMIPPEAWDQVYFNQILPKKIETDLQYMQRATVFSDIMLIFKTLFKV
ncbi:MAG: sugar transferase [Gemmatimonadetes bacterium]|nr:MAG: sugar transferase [Gemmatimonadota bacterium]